MASTVGAGTDSTEALAGHRPRLWNLIRAVDYSAWRAASNRESVGARC
ncbi:hypothetical protein ACFVUS_10615 [Nocardia sp. NPDC058058]